MILYLKLNNCLKRVPEIILHQCFIPKIAEVTETRIEPAIWFKVLVFDSMLVDCDNRRVYWSVESLPETSNFHHVDESHIPVDGVIDYFSTQDRLFEDSECYDYDPFVDELFDMATEIAMQYLQGQINSDLHMRIIQLLHCFILPKIKLKMIHMQYLEVALKWVDQGLKQVEEKIKHKDNSKRNTENSLRRQREKMMQTDDFTKELFVATCNREFLDFCLTHIMRDVKKSNEKLVCLQEEIDTLRSSTIEEKQQKLIDIRKERDLEHDQIIKLQTVRETIKNVIGRPHVKRKKRKLPKKTQDSIMFQEIYVEISRRYQTDISDIHELLLSKLKMHSVREAIHITIQELNEEGESVGYHHKLGSSEIDTDILDQNQRPTEWLTLEEKVQNLFDLNHDGFQSKFEKYCESVLDKCQQIIAERNMFGGMEVPEAEGENGTCSGPEENMECSLPVTPTSVQFLNIMGRFSQCRRSYDSQGVNYACSSIRSRIDSLTLSQGISQEALEGITKSIMENLTEMSKDIAVEISSENDKIPRTLVNKMYISYERRVAEKLMPKLAELYILKFELNIQSLRKWLAHVTLTDIGIDDTVFQKLMGQAKVSSVLVQEQETGTLNDEETMVKHPLSSEDGWHHHESKTSLRLRKCSLTTLYEYADRECKDMPEFFENNPLEQNHDMEVQTNSSEGSESSEFHENSVGLCESHESQGLFSGLDDSENCPGNFNNMDEFTDLQGTHDAEHGYVRMKLTDHNQSQNVDKKKCPSDTCEVKVTSVNEMYVEMRFPTRKKQPDDELDPHQPPPYDTIAFTGNSDVPSYSCMSPMYQNFVANFEKFDGFFSKMISSVSIFKKLRHITKALRYTEEQLRGIREKNGDSSPVMSDDLLTIIIILLIRMNPKLMHHLYAHLNLIIALLPPFMAGNAHDYALVTLHGAFQYLNDQFALHKTIQN